MAQTKIILLDVDDTLYAAGTGPFAEVVGRIRQYVEERLGLDVEAAAQLRHEYVSRYGSTLGGLMIHHGVDPDEYLDYVHDVDVEALLPADERLRRTLAKLPGTLAVFSSGSRGYVKRVLNALGVADLFAELLTIECFDYVPKPQERPYRVALATFGRSPSEMVVVDDRPDNVRAAIDLGMQGVVVGGGNHNGLLCIPDIYALADVIG